MQFFDSTLVFNFTACLKPAGIASLIQPAQNWGSLTQQLICPSHVRSLEPIQTPAHTVICDRRHSVFARLSDHRELARYHPEAWTQGGIQSLQTNIDRH